jgi:hypothetical protein
MKKLLSMVIVVTGVFVLSDHSLLSMRRRPVIIPDEEKNFESLSRPVQGLLVHDAITHVDVTQLSLYLYWGWPCDESLNIEAHITWNALAWAIFLNRLSIVKLLVEKGANVAAETDRGVTALRFAHRLQRRSIEKYLMEHYTQNIVPTMVQPRNSATEYDDEMSFWRSYCGCCACCAMTILAMWETYGNT